MDNTYDGTAESRPDYIRSLLKASPLILDDFHPDDVLEFLQAGTKLQFVDGNVVNESLPSANSACLIAMGKVGIWEDRIQLAVYEKGAFVGETFLFNKHSQPGRIVAIGDTTLLHFDRGTVLSYFRNKPSKLFNIFTRNIIHIQKVRLDNTNKQLCKLKKRILDDRI